MKAQSIETIKNKIRNQSTDEILQAIAAIGGGYDIPEEQKLVRACLYDVIEEREGSEAVEMLIEQMSGEAIDEMVEQVTSNEVIHLKLQVTEYCPEEMRVVEHKDLGLFTVQSFSKIVGDWIVNAEWKSLDAAIQDCKNWYPNPNQAEEKSIPAQPESAAIVEGQTIEIDYVQYIVKNVETIEEIERDYPNTAKQMNGKVAARLLVQRPKGKKLYAVTAFVSGQFSKPLSI